jgi:hypothetical protein
MGAALEATRADGTGREPAGGDWPRRIVWAALLIWLAPAIVVVLLVGGVGAGVGAAARLVGRRDGQARAGRGPARAVEAVRAPHLGSIAAGLRSARRR